MIRFSAALVAVAIGVLIGGIATSKLLLVYIAIVVSAVALLALAIGVVLKREELFGEEQGLVPADAGASPVLQPPPSALGAATARSRRGRACVRHGLPLHSPRPRRPRRAAASAGTQGGRTSDPVPPWETKPSQDPWARQPGHGPAGLACRRPGQPSGLAARSAGRSPTRSRGCNGVVRCGTGR